MEFRVGGQVRVVRDCRTETVEGYSDTFARKGDVLKVAKSERDRIAYDHTSKSRQWIPKRCVAPCRLDDLEGLPEGHSLKVKVVNVDPARTEKNQGIRVALGDVFTVLGRDGDDVYFEHPRFPYCRGLSLSANDVVFATNEEAFEYARKPFFKPGDIIEVTRPDIFSIDSAGATIGSDGGSKIFVGTRFVVVAFNPLTGLLEAKAQTNGAIYRFHCNYADVVDAAPDAYEPVPTATLSHAANPEYEKLVNDPTMEAFRERTVKIDVPHLLEKTADDKKPNSPPTYTSTLTPPFVCIGLWVRTVPKWEDNFGLFINGQVGKHFRINSVFPAYVTSEDGKYWYRNRSILCRENGDYIIYRVKCLSELLRQIPGMNYPIVGETFSAVRDTEFSFYCYDIGSPRDGLKIHESLLEVCGVEPQKAPFATDYVHKGMIVREAKPWDIGTGLYIETTSKPLEVVEVYEDEVDVKLQSGTVGKLKKQHIIRCDQSGDFIFYNATLTTRPAITHLPLLDVGTKIIAVQDGVGKFYYYEPGTAGRHGLRLADWVFTIEGRRAESAPVTISMEETKSSYPEYEYKFVRLPFATARASVVLEILNREGKDGWQLASPHTSSTEHNMEGYLMGRRRRPAPNPGGTSV